MTATFPSGTILGYPRIGRRRELKRAVERHWAGQLDEAGLEEAATTLRRATRERLAELGLGRSDSSIPESFSFYDQVLDAAVTVGALPTRFADLRAADGSIPLSAYFTAARGAGERAPLEMTKWFDTNYHYLVPEIGPETVFSLSSDRVVRQVVDAAADGFVVRPVLVGPVTLLALSKPSDDAPEGFSPLERLDDVLPVYVEVLAALREAGAEWVQLDEPALVSESLGYEPKQLADAARRAYAALGEATARPQILVAAPYGPLSGPAWETLTAAAVEAVAIDLHDAADLPAAAEGLSTKTLVGGVIDGRNVWRGDLAAAADRLDALRAIGAASVAAGTSTSLQHVPHDVADESELDGRLVSWLAFADQKVAQVVTLRRGLTDGRDSIADELDAATAALADRHGAPGVADGSVRARAAALGEDDADRGDFAVRVEAQNSLGLPVLPTTTIGSFPQTGDIRRARAAHGRGELSATEYQGFLRQEIERVIDLQEELGLDVLVHGEAERNDMVQYFAENLDGFAVTQNGWVQSYGSRATRPSILWGDVSRPAPITVDWATYAQSLSTKHVKGMLTGPVTILAWSFVRDDQPLAETADQVALALRDEITDLEAAGIRIIQVDEPALRELLPLRLSDQPAYLEWSVRSFRLATAGAADATQIHTHLCYSEFGVVIDAIAALDADVTSIEAARSRGEVIGDIATSGFAHGIGPGVYDIHSPRVPSVDEIEELLQRAADELPLHQVWVNPDCGLKTRGYDETVASLRNLVTATERVRESLVAASQ